MDKKIETGIYFIDGDRVGMGTTYFTEKELENLLSGNFKRYIEYKRIDIKGKPWEEMDHITTYVNPKYVVDVWVYEEAKNE